jgi:hypothetical protein
MKSQLSKRLFSLCLVLVSLTAIAFADKPNQLSNLSITTILESNDLSGAVADIQSDNLGPYHDGVDGVTSFLTTNGYNGIVWGDWQFGTLNSTTRKVSIGFTNPIPVVNGGTATPNPPFTAKTVIAHIEDKCTMISYSMIKMTAGQSFPCPAIVHFYDSNTYEYRTYFAPNWTQPPTPETTFVQVTCNTVATDGSGCNDWYIDPIPTHDAGGNPISGKAIGRLVFNGCSSCPKGTGHTTTTGNLGDYYFQFHFHLTRP